MNKRMKKFFKQCFLRFWICCFFKIIQIDLFFSKDVKQKKEKTNFKKELKNEKNTAFTQESQELRRDTRLHQEIVLLREQLRRTKHEEDDANTSE